MMMELLPLALSDVNIGSNYGSEMVSSCNCFLFISRNFANARGKPARVV